MADAHAALHGEYLKRPSYAFLQTIAEGNVGECRLYNHEVLGFPVVSKTVSLVGIPGGIASTSGEPHLLEALKHDHIVKLLEAQWAPEWDPSLRVVTFTTNYCEGRSVCAALDEGHLFSTSDALQITANVLDALAYLHEEKGVLHRDIKTGNVLLDRGRRHGFVCDLGSAAYLDSMGSAPRGGGTPLYLAPEAASGALTVRSDLYSVGVVMLELLNGPFPYDDIDPDKVDARLAQGRRALSDRSYDPAPWVPAPVATIVRKLTAKNAGDRPASAAAALKMINDAKITSWLRKDGAALTGSWLGSWPSTVPSARRRSLRVNAVMINSGKHRGRVLLEAADQAPGKTTWRGYASLTRRVPPNDPAALAAFFREVEGRAQVIAVS